MEKNDADALASGIFAFRRWFSERIAAEQVPVIVMGLIDGHSVFENNTCHFFVVTPRVPKYSTELSAASLMALGRGRPEEAGALKRDLDRIVSAIRA